MHHPKNLCTSLMLQQAIARCTRDTWRAFQADTYTSADICNTQQLECAEDIIKGGRLDFHMCHCRCTYITNACTCHCEQGLRDIAMLKPRKAHLNIDLKTLVTGRLSKRARLSSLCTTCSGRASSKLSCHHNTLAGRSALRPYPALV